MVIALRRETHAPADGVRVGSRPVYAVGDVHGCYDLLFALLGEIGRDASERYPSATPLLILCGDYIDRGPASSKVLAALAWLVRSNAIETRLLEGNHEAVLKMFLEHPTEHGKWLSFGGRQTLESYGIAVPDVVNDAALTAMRDRLLDVMPSSHHRLLDQLEPLIEVGGYTFAHAGVMPGVPLARQSRDDLLWIREEFLDHPRPAACVIVHGHTWADDRPTVLPHRIGIDTGAYETGVLTGLHLTDDRIEIIQAVRAKEDAPAASEPGRPEPAVAALA